MKKYFLSIVALAAMLFATSCQESLVEPQLAGPTTFSVQLPDQMGTKAFGDESSTNATINKLYVQVYSEDGNTLVYQPSEPIAVTSGSASFSVNLIQDQKYDIIFWAQKDDAYTTTNLKSIPMDKRFHNVEDGAAFFAFLDDFVPTGTSQPVTLKRPFAQLNLGTTPASLKTDVKADSVELVKSYIKVSNVASSFSPVSGYGVGETQTMEFTLADVPAQKLYVSGEMYYYVSMDYLPIAGDDQALVTVDATINTSDGNITHTFTNVPVKENYRTNIIGNLISSTTDFVVTIEEGFVDENNNPNPDNDYLVVDNVAAANAALNAGETYVAINYIRNIENGDTITLPAAAEYYLQIPAVDAKLNIVGEYATKVYITLVENNSAVNGIELNIDTPSATVTVSKLGNPRVKNITASTAPNTLILDGITVAEVVIKQGNVIVENNSEVGEIEPEGNAGDITIYVDETSEVEDVDNSFTLIEEEEEGDIKFITSAAKLQQLAKSVNNDGNNFAGQIITLLADIDLNNVEWTPIGTEDNYFAGTFEGNGHTIKNLTVVETEAKEGKAFIGFFGYAKNATIEDLTFENVYLNIACLDIDHSQGHIGAVAGSLEGTSTIENVTIKGDIKVESTVTANGASRVAVVAGGNSYGDVKMKEVHVIANEGSYLKANNNVGALAGQLQGKSVFENCSSNIDVTGTKFFAGGIIGLAAGDQTFTNCRTTGDITITAGREGRAHDQYRVGGIAGGWSDGAKNVCTLTGCTYTGKVSGKNSDGSVANPLDYAGYVGRGYTLNGCQGSKVIIDGEEYVEYVQAFNTAAEAGIYYINGVWTINSAAELKMLADKVNGGVDYFEGKTIKLGADIDLKNEEWIPIGSATKDHGFMGNFDGNNKTIKNLMMTKLIPDSDKYVYAGLFGVTEGTDAENQNYIKDLVIENVTIETTGHIAAAAIAYPYYTQVENITVNGKISIKGGNYTSGVLAYTRRCIDAKDLTIQGSEESIITGDQTVGGVISDIQMNGGLKANYSNFKAAGLTITATNKVGGISGIISNQTLVGATVENVTINCPDARRGIVSGCLGDPSKISNITYDNVSGADKIVGAAYDDAKDVIAKGDEYFVVTYTEVSTADELVAALEGNKNVIFLNDIQINPANMSNGYGTTGINVKNGQIINGNGFTLNIQGAGGTWDSGINTTGGIIKNITVTGSFRGIFINHTSTHSEKVILENVTIGGNGTVYTISCDQGMYQGIEATNCTFNGWTSFAKTAGEAKFVNCNFGEGSGYKYCRPYSNTEFVNCTFCPGYAVDQSQAEVTFTDCTWEK